MGDFGPPLFAGALMITIKILRNTIANKKIVRAGEVHSIPDREALFLIGIKKAEKHEISQITEPISEEIKTNHKKGKKNNG